MATVKRNGDKVILKGGKVSCSCCGCCMYPSQALFDGLYTIQDLPDVVVQVGSTTIIFTKLSSPTPSEDPSVHGGTAMNYYHGIDRNGSLVGVGLDGEGIEWLGTELANEDAEFGECLLSIQTFQPDPLVWSSLRDQFASSYSISGPVSGTVTRTSICTWEGTNLSLVNFGYKWRINGNAKSGLQNTPVGSYAGGFSVS